MFYSILDVLLHEMFNKVEIIMIIFHLLNTKGIFLLLTIIIYRLKVRSRMNFFQKSISKLQKLHYAKSLQKNLATKKPATKTLQPASYKHIQNYLISAIARMYSCSDPSRPFTYIITEYTSCCASVTPSGIMPSHS